MDLPASSEITSDFSNTIPATSSPTTSSPTSPTTSSTTSSTTTSTTTSTTSPTTTSSTTTSTTNEVNSNSNTNVRRQPSYSDSPDVNHSLVSKLFTACRETTFNQSDITKQLVTLDLQQLDLNTLTNSVGEAPVHISAAAGNVDMVKILVDKGVSLNVVDRNGDTPLILAVRNNREEVVGYLIEKHADLNIQNEDKETALHTAVKVGNSRLVESILLSGGDPNLTNQSGETPLHVACKLRNVPISCMLIYLGAKMNIADLREDTALHVASREGSFSVVQLMCTKNIDVNQTNKAGSTALLIAAKLGYIDIVRVLLLAGADIDHCDKDGFNAEDLALGQGHKEISDLILDLSGIITDKRSLLASQLLPGNSQMDRLKVKVFGSREVGKSTLIESMKCSYMWGVFRRIYGGFDNVNVYEATNEPLKSGIQAPLTSYTKGINVQQVTVPGVGNLSIWEFSGYEPYYAYYDVFVGDPSCIHIVTFSLYDDMETRKYQIYFWLQFIKARVAPAEPIGLGGSHLWAPHILFVATHADATNTRTNMETGEMEMEGWTEMCEELMDEFYLDFVILKKLHVLDAREHNSVGMKEFKKTLTKLKDFLLSYYGNGLGILNPVIKEIPSWVRSLGVYPVVTWSAFMDHVRRKVNALATEDHIKELVGQLQVVGEIIYLLSTSPSMEDLIVLNPKWFTNQLLGETLSYEVMCSCPIDGRYTPEQLKLVYQDLDISDLKNILKCLDVCIESIYPDGQIFYDFPALDFTPHPEDIWSNWPPARLNLEEDDGDGDKSEGILKNDDGDKGEGKVTKDGDLNKNENDNDDNDDNDNVSEISQEGDSKVKHNNKERKKVSSSQDSKSVEEIWHGIQVGCMDQSDAIGDQIGVIFPRVVLSVRRAINDQERCPVTIREMRQWGSGMRLDCDGFATTVSLSVTQQHVDVIMRGFKSSVEDMFEFSEYLSQSIVSEIRIICPGLFVQRFPMSPIDLPKPTIAKSTTPTATLASKEQDTTGVNEGFEPDEPVQPTEDEPYETTYFVRVYDSKELIEAQLKLESDRTFDEINNDTRLMTNKRTIDPHSYVVNKDLNLPEVKKDDSNSLTESGSGSRDVNGDGVGVGVQEKLIDLIAMGSEDVFGRIILGKDVHISQLPVYARCLLANLLDETTDTTLTNPKKKSKHRLPADRETSFINELERKKDWRDLARLLQVSESILSEKEEAAEKSGDVTVVPVSKTDAVLALWSYKPTATIGHLSVALKEIGRSDARDVLLRSAPCYAYVVEWGGAGKKRRRLVLDAEVEESAA